MANKISKDKKQISLVLPIEMLAKLDARAALDGTNRTAVISVAVDAYLGKPDSTDSAKLDAIAARLDAMDAANRLAVAGVLDAVKNQPIAVQQQALPASEVTDADVVAYIKEKRPGIELDGWGNPMEPTAKEVRAYLEKHFPGRFEFDVFDEPSPARGRFLGKLFGRG